MKRQKRGKNRVFESLEKRELLDGKADLIGEFLPLAESRETTVQISDLLSRANLAKSNLSTEFLRAETGQMTQIVYGGSDGGTQDPNPTAPLDSPNNRIDPNTSSIYGGVVGIEVNDGFNVFYACSGTVVAPTYVLTAAHCFDNRDGAGLPGTDGVVDPFGTANVRFNNGGDSTDLIAADTITFHPSYFIDELEFDNMGNPISPNNGHDDLALVKLASPVATGTPIYKIRETAMNNGDRLQLVGYGRTGWGDFGLPGEFDPDPPAGDYYNGINPTLPLEVKRSGENLADFLFLCDDDQIDGGTGSTGSGCTGLPDEVFWFDFDDDTDPSGLGNTIEATVGPGDSGGPAFFDTGGGQLELAGVNTFVFTIGSEEGLWGSSGGGMIVERYSDWINGIIGVDVQLAGSVSSIVAGPGATDTTVTYQVTVTNDGPNTATGINIADTITLPGGVSITNTPNWNVGTLAPSASTTIDVVFEVDGSTANSADSIAIDLVASSVEAELATGDNTLNDSIDLGTGATPSGFDIRGSTWTVAYDDFALNIGANATLPWFNLNTIRITYADPLPVAPALVLQGPTNGSTLATTLTSWNGTTATHTFGNLTRGFYRAGSANVAVDFSVVPGDSSRNGQVDFFDLSFMAPLIGTNGHGPAPHIADYNGNGEVNFFDLSFMAPLIGTNLGGFVPPSASPPPPPPMSPISADVVWATLMSDADEEEEEEEEEAPEIL